MDVGNGADAFRVTGIQGFVTTGKQSMGTGYPTSRLKETFQKGWMFAIPATTENA